MMKILEENRKRWEGKENAEQAEETQTELLSDAEDEEEEMRRNAESVPTISEPLPPPPQR